MTKIDREKKTINAMVRIYCHDHHKTSDDLCVDCLVLQDYAHHRLDACPFNDAKPACNKCTVHCYSSKMSERVIEIMRYSGPRMIFRHPLLSLIHLLDRIREAPQLKKHR
ncbi:MAG: nitrous oxide-stimulated promoter family protein [Proteobacteria bacterium]|nr:nitrous oxide-stimulated promoter family protein [Pseudomonadota bacterium]